MNLGLYVIIDSRLIRPRPLLSVAREIVAGNAAACQLREKNMSDRDLYKLAAGIRKITARSKTLFLVNDRLDIALAADADGVHLGSTDLPVKIARKVLGKDKIIGVTVRNLSGALRAQREGADYLSLGPIFPTKTKKNLPPPRGLKLITRIKKKIKVPLIAIGGINKSNVARVIGAGADGIAVVSAVTAADNIREVTRGLLSIIREVKR
jgi:thiamine-phosphate pyrophosphorylase